MSNFLRNRRQRVVLNEQTSSWADVNAGIPQGSILDPLLSLICINELADDLSSKLFVDEILLFSFVYNANTTAKELSDDLVKINRLVSQWKMIFNPDPSKQGQGAIFNRKTKKEYHLHPLSFEDHLKMILNKGNKNRASTQTSKYPTKIGTAHYVQNIY